MKPAGGNRLLELSNTAEWISYAASMNKDWLQFDAHRLQPIRVWRTTELSAVPAATLLYPFSGPDFVYAETFFPGARTIILCGLEPVGAVPTEDGIIPLANVLAGMEASVKTLLEAGYFVTKEMRAGQKMGALQGIVPVLCLMLARSGDRITSIEADAGHAEVQYVSAFDGRPRTLLYFSLNLSNDNLKNGSAFMKFLQQAKPDTAYIKAASYLMHEQEFSNIRSFVLEHCSTIIQDDSGIPLRFFDTARWRLHLYGVYAPPLSIFKKYDQPDLAALYARSNPLPLSFGSGYHWDPATANLLVARIAR
jgi:hypothetical protein